MAEPRDDPPSLPEALAEIARLRSELKQSHVELGETLEEQAATNHILEIISQSPTDVQPVLDAIVASAAKLTQTDNVVIRLREGDFLVASAHHGPIPAGSPSLRWDSEAVPATAAREARMIYVPDWLVEGLLPSGQAAAARMDFRSQVVVPLLREGVSIGVLGLRHPE